MARLRSNQFALLSAEHSDSDDSGYIEDDSDPSTEDVVDRPNLLVIHLEHVVLKNVNPEGRELVRRRDPAESQAPAPEVLSYLSPCDYARSGRGSLVPPGNWREHDRETISQHRRDVSAHSA
jgi:hypothetical protein